MDVSRVDQVMAVLWVLVGIAFVGVVIFWAVIIYEEHQAMKKLEQWQSQRGPTVIE